jgi:ABC-type transport system involved in cytochrome c biogenesis permease subunit
VVPIPEAKHQEWASLADLLQAKLDDTSDPGGRFRKVKDQFLRVRTAYLEGSAEAFNDASAAFLATVAEVGPRLGTYPKEATIRLEVAYNHWAPFRFAWMFTVLSILLVLSSWASVLLKRQWNGKLPYVAGMGAYLLGLLATVVGFWMRVAISGRAPVTNMYESVVFMAAGTLVFGLTAELMVRKRFLLVAAAVISAFALVVADICSGALDPSLRPLQPVLRHNLWLVIHVMVIMLGYAAFALALGIGNFTLGYCMLPPGDRPLLGVLTRLNYKVLQVGVLLLVIGTILGGLWADYSWGRFWGWDPKEVWALITLLGYLAFLHARYLGWVKDRGLAAWSVLCFALVVMAWYGVNFVLQSGLHAYAFGGGGQLYVIGVLLAQFLYVLAALLVSYVQDLAAS